MQINKKAGPELSAPGAAALLLFWQEPGDRALTGWTPYPSLHPDAMSAEALTRWLREQMFRTGSEEHDAAQLRGID
jgi:hypothetical protein